MVELDFDAVRQEKKERESGGLWKPDDGENVVRLLPPFSDFEDRALDYVAIHIHQHYIRREGLPDVKTRCLQDNDEYCPACAASSKYWESDDPNYQEIARNIKPKERHLLNMVDMDEPELGVQVMDAHYFIYDEGILPLTANEDWGAKLFDPYNGNNIVITVTPNQRGDFPGYNVMPQSQSTDVTKHLSDGWEEDLDLLEQRALEYKDAEDIEKAIRDAGLPVGNSGSGSNGASGNSSDERSTERKAVSESVSADSEASDQPQTTSDSGDEGKDQTPGVEVDL